MEDEINDLFLLMLHKSDWLRISHRRQEQSKEASPSTAAATFMALAWHLSDLTCIRIMISF
jgi:hypothetical protein